jgi:hypothetical protein
MSANDEQIGGRHYIEKPFQPWDYIVGNKMGYLEGNIIKYVSRYKEKNGVEDLIKASHYLDKLIEVTRNEQKRLSEITVSTTSSPREEIDQIWQK